MAKLLKLRRGTTTQHGSFTGAEGEVTIDTTKDTAVVHDGSQAGGRPLAREDMTNVSSASIAGRLSNDSIAPAKIGAGTLPSDVTVASANLVDGTIVNADVNASAAIAGTKVSPDFGSQNITTTGTGTIGSDLTVSGGDLTINGTVPSLHFNDTDHESDYQMRNYNGTLQFLDVDQSGGTVFYQRETNGDTTVTGNLNVTNGADITGNITATGDLTVSGGDITLNGTSCLLNFNDTNNNPDFRIQVESGNFLIEDATNSYADRFVIDSNGTISVAGNLDVGAGIDVTGNMTVTGTVDGRDVASDGSKLDGIESGATADQTAAEIRTLVESASDSNVFTDADHSKLNGIESGATADQSASEIATALNGQNVYTTGNIGRDSNDHIVFTDDSRLDVVIAGNNEFRFEADGDFHADGDITAFSTTVASDSRLKSDIHTINNALGIVGKLRGVSYKWLRDGRSDIGVIAQEVEEVIPEIVKTKTTLGLDGQEEMKTVDYGKIVGVLINAINELKEEVEELKNAKITG